MIDLEYAIRYLLAIEKKHNAYFKQSKLDIMNCVEIKGKPMVSIHVINKALPADIVYDIEMTFWKN